MLNDTQNKAALAIKSNAPTKRKHMAPKERIARKELIADCIKI